MTQGAAGDQEQGGPRGGGPVGAWFLNSDEPCAGSLHLPPLSSLPSLEAFYRERNKILVPVQSAKFLLGPCIFVFVLKS